MEWDAVGVIYTEVMACNGNRFQKHKADVRRSHFLKKSYSVSILFRYYLIRGKALAEDYPISGLYSLLGSQCKLLTQKEGVRLE